jgi:hypothetical protein
MMETTVGGQMNSSKHISDMELEQEFQKLKQLDAEQLMPTLAKLRVSNPRLFNRLVEHIERRWTEKSSPA